MNKKRYELALNNFTLISKSLTDYTCSMWCERLNIDISEESVTQF